MSPQKRQMAASRKAIAKNGQIDTQLAVKETNSDSPALPIEEIISAADKFGNENPIVAEMWIFLKESTTEESVHRRKQESDRLAAMIADTKRSDNYALTAFILAFIVILIILLTMIILAIYSTAPWQVYFAIAGMGGAGVPFFLKTVLKTPNKDK